MKIQKILIFLFIFIIILLIPNDVFAYGFLDNNFGYLYYSNMEDLTGTSQTIPTIEYFDTFEELKKYNLNEMYFWYRSDANDLNKYQLAHFTLLYLNEETGQALFDFDYNTSSNEGSTSLLKLGATYYFTDINRNIYNHVVGEQKTKNGLIAFLDENGLISNFHHFSNVGAFRFNPNNTTKCSFLTNYETLLNYVEVVDGGLNWVSNITYNYNQHFKYSYDYNDKSILFFVPPVWSSIQMGRGYFSDTNTPLSNRDLFKLEYYFSTSSLALSPNESSKGIFDYSNIILYERNIEYLPKSTQIESIYLYVDDFNLKKRFQFNLQIPIRDENTKYYLFLQDYVRTDYNNTIGLFKVVTIDLPEDFDSTGYYNYLYYDNLLKKYIAPAGVEIKIYDCSVDSGSVGECTLIKEYTGIRDSITLNEEFSLTYAVLNGCISSDTYATHYQLDTLIPTDKVTNNNFLTGILADALLFSQNENGESSLTQEKILEFLSMEDIHDFIYNYGLKIFYYDNSYIDIYDNFIGGNANIISYENSTNGYNASKIYYLFRQTNVYSQENRIDSTSYFFNYSDNEDVIAMLPEDVDNSYLNSSFYINNPNSSSGGYITYNITNIYGYNDYIINYGKDNNSIRDLPNTNFIDNFEVGNDIVLNGENNVNINIIENSSNEISILNNIYTTLLRIEKKLGNIGDSVINNVDNISNTSKNFFIVLFIPNFNNLQEDFEEITDTAEEHLGFLYQPFVFITFFFESIADINEEEIVFHSPQVNIMGYQVLPEMYFDFNEQLFNTSEIWQNIRTIQLLICNFVLVTWFINFMIKVYGEVFKNDN